VPGVKLSEVIEDIDSEMSDQPPVKESPVKEKVNPLGKIDKII
jgi:hypothetical protein